MHRHPRRPRPPRRELGRSPGVVVVVVDDVDRDGDVEVDATFDVVISDRRSSRAARGRRRTLVGDNANRFKIARTEAMECASSLEQRKRVGDEVAARRRPTHEMI